jgi:hypothetical protein
MYQGTERRLDPRHQGPKMGVILLDHDALVGCTVRDFSPVSVGLLLADVLHLPPEFDVTFSHTSHHCVTVWQQLDRMGLKFKSLCLGHGKRPRLFRRGADGRTGEENVLLGSGCYRSSADSSTGTSHPARTRPWDLRR